MRRYLPWILVGVLSVALVIETVALLWPSEVPIAESDFPPLCDTIQLHEGMDKHTLLERLGPADDYIRYQFSNSSPLDETFSYSPFPVFSQKKGDDTEYRLVLQFRDGRLIYWSRRRPPVGN